MQSKQGNVILILKQKDFQCFLVQFEILRGKKAIYTWRTLKSPRDE